MLATGCDKLFDLDRLPVPLSDAKLDGVAGDGPVDTPDIAECPVGFVPNAVGTSYKLAPDPLGWTAAKAACKNLLNGGGLHTHLAVLVDKVEYDAAWIFIGGMGSPWVGAFDTVLTDQQAKFEWVTNENAGSMAWDLSQPDQPDTQACARMRTPTGMDNETCAMIFTYLCECDTHPDIY